MKRHKATALTLTLFALVFASAAAQEDGEQSGGPPPAQVVVSTVEDGVIAPTSEFLGTFYYNQVGRVASEVDGLVDEMFFDFGQRVKKGQTLVRLNNDLLVQDLNIREDGVAEMKTELEKARLDLKRSTELYEQKSVSEQVYDDDRFALMVKEKQLAALQTAVERLKTQISKKTIMAPFDGVVIDRLVELGEWVDEGGAVAELARTDVIDLVANVPQNVLPYLKKDMEVQARVNGNEITGKIYAIIPQGDVATRTFPVRVRIENPDGTVFEGMEGFLRLPTDEEQKCLELSRDAIIRQQGNTIVYSVVDGKAAINQVQVVGYRGKTVGVTSPTLKAGDSVVIAGNERLRPGQGVAPRDSLDDMPNAAEEPPQQSKAGTQKGEGA